MYPVDLLSCYDFARVVGLQMGKFSHPSTGRYKPKWCLVELLHQFWSLN